LISGKIGRVNKKTGIGVIVFKRHVYDVFAGCLDCWRTSCRRWNGWSVTWHSWRATSRWTCDISRGSTTTAELRLRPSSVYAEFYSSCY